ncbi:uncharacterized protein ColSpa_04708 [Colletotrichum spaethianum]|uniref:Uncharacterized protein n=1 Tax=Colletotrichum spaethianum TaxID=700344 RepID=A0AA37NWQ0_9PEZI|nr:uncharacterized protein ColSpa_04708 [Colletotrichum spaethianum]GKT44527.1 hypothetical protein ColSpa_04708 [Colletotrichum spaethianum]
MPWTPLGKQAKIFCSTVDVFGQMPGITLATVEFPPLYDTGQALFSLQRAFHQSNLRYDTD